MVVIGGGVAARRASCCCTPPARPPRQFVLPGVGTRTEIRVARYGPEAGVLGAALLAGQELLLERHEGAAMRIAVAFDHAGVPLRDAVLDTLRDAGHDADDLGACDDYPDIALRVGGAVLAEAGRARDHRLRQRRRRRGRRQQAARHPRDGRHDTYTAAQCVSHDDCNVLCLGARVIGPAYAADCVRAFAAASSPARSATCAASPRSPRSSDREQRHEHRRTRSQRAPRADHRGRHERSGSTRSAAR